MSALADLPEHGQEILRQRTVAQVATTGPDGHPHCTPVWFVWDGDVLRFSLTTTRQKYRNLRSDPRLALNVVDPGNPYAYVEVRGRATLEPDPDHRFIDRLAQRYLDQPTYPWHQPGDVRVTVTVAPTHATWQIA